MGQRHRWLAAVALAVATTFLLIFALRLPLSRLDVPYMFNGDAVDKLAQIETVAETGWLFDSPRLGFPFGYDRLDFPRFDSLNYAVMGPIAAWNGQPGLAMNLYFIAGFYLIAAAALFAFLRLGLSMGPAFICALVYAFLPYHMARGVSHLTNGAYFLVPLAVLVLIWIARGELDPASPGARRRWWLALGMALLLPLQTPYNGVFFAVLCMVAGAAALARLTHWRSLWPALVLAAATTCAFVAEQIPSLMHKAEVGANLTVATRSPQEAETYAMRLNQVLLPHSNHRVAAVAQAKQAFEQAMNVPLANEFRDQYIGVFGVLGLLALLWSMARAATATSARGATPLERNVRIAALLAIAILLLAMSGGVFTLTAYWLTSKIRATNRILPFLAFACLLGSGWLLQTLVRRIRHATARHVAMVCIGALALADVTSPFAIGNRDAIVANFDRLRGYFDQVERYLGKDASVFQLPVVWYPEHLPIGDMGDYEEFKPYLFTHTLRFSYGAARGRPGYVWGSTAAALAPADMVEEAYRMGFDAILIDALAYSNDELAALTDAFAKRLPQPVLTSADKRWHLFPLKDCCGSAPRIPAQGATTIAPYAADGTPIAFGIGGRGGFYQAGGWDDAETWGVWSLGETARLRLRLAPEARGPLVLSMEAIVLLGPKSPSRRLVIEANGRVLGDLRFDLDAPKPALHFPLPDGLIGPDDVLELRFQVSPVTSPRAAGVNDDERPLGIGLSSLSIGPEPEASHP